LTSKILGGQEDKERKNVTDKFGINSFLSSSSD